MSFPIASGQEPYHYDHKPTGRPNGPGKLQEYKAHYQGVPNEALYAFGHGLTYGDMRYSNLVIDAPTLAWGGSFGVSATVTNAGRIAAEEVVQLYIRDRVASVTRPVRELKAFRKIRLAPGASAQAMFKLSRAELEFIGMGLKPTVEPGTFDLWIAPSAQAEGVHSTFELGAA